MTRVLIVDDDFDFASLIRLALKSCGYEVSIALNGARALAAQRANPADVVLTDIFMPEMDGIETIVALRKEFPATGIIAMTAGSRVGHVDYLRVARTLGADQCLKKPFEVDELLAAVREAAVAGGAASSAQNRRRLGLSASRAEQ